MAASVRRHCGKQGFSGRAFAKGLLIRDLWHAGVAGHSALREGDRRCAVVAELVPDQPVRRIGVGWLNASHTRVMLVLWSWMLFCTLIAARVQTVEQAVAAQRLFMFTAAPESWVLADPRSRRHGP